MKEMLLGNILRRNASAAGLRDKTALIFGEEVLTYSELNDRVNQLANGLIDLGVKRGNRVAVLGRNSNTYVMIYFALAKIGAIMVPVNFWYRSKEIEYTLRHSQSSVLILDGRFVNAVKPALEGHPLKEILYYGQPPTGRHTALEDIIDASLPDEPNVEVTEDDPHIILYTSGTTGFPKGATLSHKSHYLHAMSIAKSTGGHPEDIGVILYPLFHTGGPDCVLLPHFLLGATGVVLDGAEPEVILSATERHHVTNIFCVPTVWRWILTKLRAKNFDVGSVRRCLASSDILSPEILEEMLQKFDADVYNTYGLTEAGCVLTVCRLSREDRSKLGSVGRPMASVQLRLVDEEGQPVKQGEVGEVVAQTPSVMKHYWNMPEETAHATRDGWLHSGDLGRLDEDGYLFISGRAKDMIISAGENIYPIEIERLLKENHKIRDVAIIGIPDPEWGESVVAVIVPSDGADISQEEVIEYVGSRVAGYKRPKHVEIVDELPVTTATGKVKKNELREIYAKKYG